jgi:CheY-like chemotaxis protein
MAQKRTLIVEDSLTMRQFWVLALRCMRDVEMAEAEAEDGMDGLRKVSSEDGALSLGANEYLTKPIQANKVLSVGKDLLKAG